MDNDYKYKYLKYKKKYLKLLGGDDDNKLELNLGNLGINHKDYLLLSN